MKLTKLLAHLIREHGLVGITEQRYPAQPSRVHDMLHERGADHDHIHDHGNAQDGLFSVLGHRAGPGCPRCEGSE